MVDIWKYDGADYPVMLTTKDGDVYIGYVASVDDAEEDEDAPEDNISLYAGNYVITFFVSEIQSIEPAKTSKKG